MARPNEIYDRYLNRAISETNELTAEILRCDRCRHSQTMPVIGSGHPMADIFLVKFQARPAEVHEGVAFFGRAGTALMKSCQRLKIDPLQLYGTNVVKCGDVREAGAAGRCLVHLKRELAIVNPKIVVVMGEETVAALNEAALPLARPLEYQPGEIVELTPALEALVTPDIDLSLDDQRRKAAFWKAFRRLGEWYDNIPPY